MNKLKIFVICAAVLTMCSCSDEPSIETMFEDNTLFSDYTEPDYEPENPDFSENSDIDDSPEISDMTDFPEIPDIDDSPEISDMPEFTDIPEIPETKPVTEKSTATKQITTNPPESAKTTVTTVAEDDFVCIDVPYISQKEEYPTGCELVSASMLLKFYGFDISAGDLIDKGYIKQADIEYGDDNNMYCADPAKVFIGNPRSESGYGCYAPVIFNGLEKYLDNEYFDVANLSGLSLRDLCIEYIDFGDPVIIWASRGMSKTVVDENAWTIKETGEKFNWISNEHCLVLVGYDEENYYFNDPLKGSAVPYKKETAEQRYKELGSQAVTIHPWR